jgi:hypothetical protein
MLPKIEHYKSWILTTGLDVSTANGKGKEATFYGGARIESLPKEVDLTKYKYIIGMYPISDTKNKKNYLNFNYVVKEGYLQELDDLESFLKTE